MDTQELTLPVSGKKVVLRAYTTRRDDTKSEELLFAGVQAENDGTSKKINFPISNVMASQRVYIYRLVQSIDGNDNQSELQDMIDDLRSADFEALEKTVEKIVESNSPKAKEVKKTSPDTTIEN